MEKPFSVLTLVNLANNHPAQSRDLVFSSTKPTGHTHAIAIATPSRMRPHVLPTPLPAGKPFVVVKSLHSTARSLASADRASVVGAESLDHVAAAFASKLIAALPFNLLRPHLRAGLAGGPRGAATRLRPHPTQYF